MTRRKYIPPIQVKKAGKGFLIFVGDATKGIHRDSIRTVLLLVNNYARRYGLTHIRWDGESHKAKEQAETIKTW